ncbi:MAG: hypothetical protein WBQ72_18700 [Terriglobales bacterium]
MSIAIQVQDAKFGIVQEFRYPDRLVAQYTLGVPGWVRPAPQPYDLGGWPYGCGQFVEVGVRAHDDEASALGKVPNLTIRAFEEARLRDMSRLRVQLSEPNDELALEILVE